MRAVEKSTHSRLYDVFRETLVKMRKQAKMTQRQLAQKLGREHSFVGRYEIGDRRLDVVEFYWICEALGSDPERIFAMLLMDFRRTKRR
jgi:transcriptional regulator with XRE-family HTH domain